ncbi:MAG: LytTR family DNA-binding domain-containing protein [Bacteroidota bacterium]
MNIRCIAVDDEPLALTKIAAFVDRIPDLQLVGSFSSGLEALEFLRSDAVDLLLLDIQMDGLTGLELLEVLPQSPKVILTTAYDQYALKGYELDVVDYLLKPYPFPRFLKAIEKVRSLLVPQQISSDWKAEFLMLRSEYYLHKVWLKDILFIEGMKDYCRIHTPETRIMSPESMKNLVAKLPSPPFFRVHRSYIVSAERVDRLGRSQVFVGEREIPLGEQYRQAFQAYMDARRPR